MLVLLFPRLMLGLITHSLIFGSLGVGKYLLKPRNETRYPRSLCLGMEFDPLVILNPSL